MTLKIRLVHLIGNLVPFSEKQPDGRNLNLSQASSALEHQQHNSYFQPQSTAGSQQHKSGILVNYRMERQEDNEFSIDRQFQLPRKAEDVEQIDGFTGRSVAPNGRRSKPKTSIQPKK